MNNLFICSIINRGRLQKTFVVHADTISRADGLVRIANMKQVQAKDEPLIKMGDNVFIQPVEFENGIMEIV